MQIGNRDEAFKIRPKYLRERRLSNTVQHHRLKRKEKTRMLKNREFCNQNINLQLPDTP